MRAALVLGPPSFKTEIAHPGRMCYVCLRSVSNTLTFGLCFHLVDERTTTPENQTAWRKRNREIPRPSTCNIPSLPSIAQLFNFTINNNNKTWLTSWHITTTTREDRTPCNIQLTHDVYVYPFFKTFLNTSTAKPFEWYMSSCFIFFKIEKQLFRLIFLSKHFVGGWRRRRVHR